METPDRSLDHSRDCGQSTELCTFGRAVVIHGRVRQRLHSTRFRNRQTDRTRFRTSFGSARVGSGNRHSGETPPVSGVTCSPLSRPVAAELLFFKRLKCLRQPAAVWHSAHQVTCASSAEQLRESPGGRLGTSSVRGVRLHRLMCEELLRQDWGSETAPDLNTYDIMNIQANRYRYGYLRNASAAPARERRSRTCRPWLLRESLDHPRPGRSPAPGRPAWPFHHESPGCCTG